MERTVAALQHYRRILDAYGVEMPDCYGTSAMREAGNREEFIVMARQRSNIAVRVMTERDEAYYTYLSVRNDEAIDGDELFIVDIGGAAPRSLWHPREIRRSCRFPWAR